MIRRKHKLVYNIYYADELSEWSQNWIDDGKKIYYGGYSIICHSKKEVFENLHKLIGNFGYIEVEKETQKYQDDVFVYNSHLNANGKHKGIVYNKIGYEDKE